MAKTTKKIEIDGRPEIVWLPINSIIPHPKNPRRDLGDLTELAASIKANGVLQNLTVVRQETGEYTAVIGHRRLAAAKLAGLTELPCVVMSMSEKQQVGAMMTENVQRSDLSVIEQADGFQMLLDLGDTVSGIAENTGFSESTVRRRIKLHAFSREKLLASMERGVTLDDYAELDKVKDAKTRDDLLEHIGTSNFGWKLKEAISKEAREESFARVRARLDGFATCVTETTGYIYVKGFSPTETEFPVPEDTDVRKYVYTKGFFYTLYRESDAENAPSEEEQAAKEARRAKERENELARATLVERAYKSRYAYIKAFSYSKRFAAEIMRFAVQTAMGNGGYFREPVTMTELLGVETPEKLDGNEVVTLVTELAKEQPERILLLTSYFRQGDGKLRGYFGWGGRFVENPSLDRIYDLLELLGYEMSDEECAYRDGTHELFVADEDEDDEDLEDEE